MWGTIVNTIAAIIGGIIGCLFGGRISERYKKIIMQGIGLSVCVIGLQSAIKTSNILVVIISLIIGGIIGEALKIEDRLNSLGDKIQSKIGKKGDNSFAEGFVTATLLFCVGAMSIVGALEGGLSGKYDILYAKSVLDFISSIILASTLGAGVLMAAVSIFVYQGIITIAASSLKPLLSTMVQNEMTAVGGVLIFAIGLSVVGIKKFKVGNLLPSIFIPIFYFPLVNLITKLF